MKKPELLAPAGDYGCFQAALKAGADAVYMGGQQYGARAYAGNFSRDEVLSALDEAHFYGKRIYLTVNTLMKQKELDRLPDFIFPFYEAGLDGVIVQDVGALRVLGENFPGLALHASTQMTVTDAAGALAYKELGVVRVVPARELSLKEAALLKKESGMEVEVFVHGAMCYCYSGQCLFSSMLGGRSGNRGRCAQPCRQPYSIRMGGGTGKPCYPLSLKDLCTIDLIPELIDAGIDSFKIEGRMKRAEYVAGVTDAYRRRIDSYLAYPKKKAPVPPQDRKLLSSLYVRTGLGSGYLKKHNGREMVTLGQPGYAGCDDGLLQEIRSRLLEKEMEVPVSFAAVLEADKPFRLTARSGELSVCMEGEMAQKAQKRPMGEEEVKKQLARTGGSGFFADRTDVAIKGDVFLPVKSINELRRSVLEKLRAARIAAFRAQRGNREISGIPSREPASAAQPRRGLGRPGLSASVSSLPQLEACLGSNGLGSGVSGTEVARIYVPSSAVNTEMLGRLEEARKKGLSTEIFLALPVIMRAETAAQLEHEKRLLETGLFSGVQTATASGLMWLEKIGWKGKAALDHRLYIWNRQTWEFWRDRMDTYCAPLEQNGREILALPAPGSGEKGRKEILAYGRIPMMVTANCIRKTAGACGKDMQPARESGQKNRTGAASEGLFLIDRYQTAFPVACDCRFCYNLIFNSVPLSLHGFLPELSESGAAFLRLDFLEESGKETEKILRLFAEGLGGGRPQPDYGFTTGHYRKGAQ